MKVFGIMMPLRWICRFDYFGKLHVGIKFGMGLKLSIHIKCPNTLEVFIVVANYDDDADKDEM